MVLREASPKNKKDTRGVSVSRDLVHTFAKRFKVYLVVNTASIFISLMGLVLCSIAQTLPLPSTSVYWLPEALAIYLSIEIRMFLAISSSLAVVRRHEHITGKQGGDQQACRPVIVSMLTYIGLIEVVQYFYLTRYFQLIDMVLPSSPWVAFLEYIAFVPKSLWIELVMDFFHYWMHRYAHKNKFLFRFAHADHHTEHHPTPWTTYEQTVMDIVLTNLIPVLITLLTGPRLTIFQLHLFLTYKSLGEVNGHNGVASKGKSFPQFPILGFCTNICLEAADHHEHHRVLIGNYSKRFRVWDDVFGTYRSPKSKTVRNESSSLLPSDGTVPCLKIVHSESSSSLPSLAASESD